MRLLYVAVLAAAAFVAPGPIVSTATSATVGPGGGPRCDGLRATIVGTPGDDRLVGTPGRDVVVALGGDDTVLGRGGDDVLCGGDGADRLEGGPGDDRLLGGRDRVDASTGERCAHGDQLDGGAGDDLLDPGADPRRSRLGCGPREQLRFRHGSGAVRVDLGRGRATGHGTDRLVVEQGLKVVGSDFDDVLLGTDRFEEFDPRAGDDRVVAGDGRDRVIEGRGGPHQDNGDDTYDMGAHNDFVQLRSGSDTVLGGDGDDWIHLRNAAPVDVDGGAGGDEVVRTKLVHDDHLSGGEGEDQLAMSLKKHPGPTVELDIPAGELTSDGAIVLVGGFELWGIYAERQVTVRGSDQPDNVAAFSYGSPDAGLVAEMGGGDDQVYADAGDDRVDGGGGDDYADLGEGADTCESVEAGPC